MTTAQGKPLPDPGLPWSNPATGRPTPPFAEYLQALERIAKLLNAGMLGPPVMVGPLVDAVNDAAAAAAGVQINGLYRTGNAVQIRLV